MKIAIHQMCSGIDPETNVDAMVDAIGQASHGGASMYFAPEMSLLIDRDRDRGRHHILPESASAGLKRLQAKAGEVGIWVHIGSMAVLDPSSRKFFNRTLVIGPDGKIRARYDKMHLFDVDLSTGESWRESSAYLAGADPVILETPLGKMGLTICYDLRFPDLYSALSRSGADIFAVPSAFTVPTGTAHWHTLLRARAIESAAFVVAAAQSGIHEDGRHTYGHSLVVDPWGDILLDMRQGEALAIADIDLGRLASVRAQIPVHRNRRDIVMPVKWE